MPDSTTNRSKTAPAPLTPARSGRSTAQSAPALSVRYWKRMRPNKVYPIVVTCTGASDVAPVTLRMLMAGAQVVPAEQPFDPSNPKESVTFYVTPLAKGSLRSERIEVLREGRKIQEIRLPSKVCTQRATLAWVLLALLIPWLMLHYLVYSPLEYRPPAKKSDGSERYVPKPAREYLGQGQQQERITDFVRDNTPGLQPVLGDSKEAIETREEIQSLPERLYVYLVRAYYESNQPIAFHVCWVLLLISLLSLYLHQESRKTVRGRPLPGAGD